MVKTLCRVVAALIFVARSASAQLVVNDASDIDHGGCGVAPLPCSLRDALTQAQAGDGWEIRFAIGTGHQTINLMSNLPDIFSRGTIDGSTQPGFAGVPLIEIHRADAGNAWRGLHTKALEGRLSVRALVINHFNGSCGDCGGLIFGEAGGIGGPGGQFVQGCWIGTDATGMAADGNEAGILDFTAGGNTFGGSTPEDRNVISGNGNGIIIGNPGYSVQTLVIGNYIGLNALGTAAVPNAGGISVGPPFPGFSPRIKIGGPPGSGMGNVIVGGTALAMNLGLGNVVEGNLIGTDATGMFPLQTQNGIFLYGETDAIVRNNVISATGNGVVLFQDLFQLGTPTTNATIQANFLGTDLTGNRVLVNGGNGINVDGAQANTIGGDASNGEGNVVGGCQYGILVGGAASTGNLILGNRIGIGLDGSPIPNTQAGVYLQGSGDTTVGGIGPGEGNVIANNGVVPPTGPPLPVPGVAIQNVTANVIRGNAIFGNTGKGIDFDFPFSSLPHPNDVGDADAGPNALQNFPLITLMTVGFPTTRIVGSLNSTPSSSFTIDFYASPSPVHPRDLVQGQMWIGFLDKVTDSSGNVSFDVTFPIALDVNTWISTTATDQSGNTSEFSQRSLFAIDPTRGPASAGNPFTLTGQLFQTGATVAFGGPSGLATNVNVASPTRITGQTPALAPGALYDVTVTNPDTSTAVMQRAWVADFLDVLSGSPLYPFVISLVSDGVTAGCGGGNYCPNNPVTRAQMAVFLLKAKYGTWWIPPPATGAVFLDVPSDSFAAAWIEELSNEGITGGCGGGNYCPNNPVTRQQMAVFLLKTEHGSSYLPPACVGVFGDVPCPSLFADWIERLYAENVTGGCSVSPALYCPANNATRGQMAVFIAKTFKLP